MNVYTFFDTDGEPITEVAADNHDQAVVLAMPDVDQDTDYSCRDEQDFFPWLGI